jgi:hypothetical protein
MRWPQHEYNTRDSRNPAGGPRAVHAVPSHRSVNCIKAVASRRGIVFEGQRVVTASSSDSFPFLKNSRAKLS